MKKSVVVVMALLTLTSCAPAKVVPENLPPEKDDMSMSHTGEQMKDMKKNDEPEMMHQGTGAWSKEDMEKMKMEEKSMSGKTMENMKDMKDMNMAEMKDMPVSAKGIYVAYSPELVGKQEKTVLFFHAPWCPSCKAADTGIKKGDIPEKIAILKVDYDSSEALKQKYEVTYQHTFVQVDKDGNMIKKWSGGNTMQDILEEIL